MKKFIFLSFSFLMISGGLWFTTTNAFTFLSGYLIYKSGEVTSAQERTDPSFFKEKREVEISHQSQVENHSDEDAQPSSLYSERPQKGDLMGELYIPKLESTLPIYHSTDEDELSKGVGHYAGSVLPGENDNAVLAGHRDTVFRNLGEVGVNDLLVVTTSAGEFTYKVKNVRIVDADDRTVIVPKPRATLTVSTCYPFTFVGAAPERYVLVAELLGQERIKKGTKNKL
ncbi:class D sortase [Salipaludibacillus keqinensis]|uniref:Class D sortase n=2 Tax=Salipaludibacillus keqinensis TaxID=2045207 RepID=A0A323TIG8_9BACI|nr:class D sortase [Salipaludibacillus keqinensis]